MIYFREISNDNMTVKNNLTITFRLYFFDR